MIRKLTYQEIRGVDQLICDVGVLDVNASKYLRKASGGIDFNTSKSNDNKVQWICLDDRAQCAQREFELPANFFFHVTLLNKIENFNLFWNGKMDLG